jgi:hypothetical protein
MLQYLSAGALINAPQPPKENTFFEVLKLIIKDICSELLGYRPLSWKMQSSEHLVCF